VGAGKDRNIYLLNRDNMGKFNPSTNNVYQQLTTAFTGAQFGAPAYFNNALYYGAVGDNLKMFPFVNAKLQTTGPSSKSSITYTYPGTVPSISASGVTNGIVWAVQNTSPAVLHAYDAANLTTELYNSNQAANGRDQFGAGNKYITPMIANGRVYVGTPNGVAVFGVLNPTSAQLSATSLNFGNQLVGTSSSPQAVTFSNLTSTPLTISGISTSGDFAQTNNCGTGLVGNGSCTINVTFKPGTTGARTGSLTVTDSASNSPQTAGLSGTGARPAVSLMPTSLSFGGQVVNTTSSPLSVTLTNTGAVPLTISSIAASGNFAVSTGVNACGSTVAAGANCLVYVTFRPTATGTRTGTLSITDNAPGSPQTAALSGTGMDFSVSASPSSLRVSSPDSATLKFTVTPVSGFTGTVSVSCSGAPTTVSCTPSPNSVALNGSSQVSTVTVVTGNGGQTSKGSFTLTLTGVSGSLTHSDSVTVRVR
jgi:hypothetical protein